MTVKVLLLKSGEDVIADVQEMLSSEEQVIGYLLNKPCIVKVRSKKPEPEMTPEETDTSEKHERIATSVSMYPWCPLAQEHTIPLSTDWVVTMYSPQDKILDMYTQDVLKNFANPDDQIDSTIGSTAVGLTD